MRYLFEDRYDDALSELFRAAYPSNVSDTFEYLNGNGGLVKRVSYLLETCNDDIFVFMDLISANISIRRIYNELRCLSMKSERLIVFPLVCSEYYFIKFLRTIEYPIKNLNAVQFCLDKKYYLDSELLNDESSRAYVKNFEKLCKLVLVKEGVILPCVRKGLDINFFNVDCICVNAENSCGIMTLRDKALGYLREYPCFPSGSYLNERVLCKDEIIKVHRQLVDEFNIWVDTYLSRVDIGNRVFSIKYMI